MTELELLKQNLSDWIRDIKAEQEKIYSYLIHMETEHQKVLLALNKSYATMLDLKMELVNIKLDRLNNIGGK